MSPENGTGYITEPVVETLKTAVKGQKRTHLTAKDSENGTPAISTSGAVGCDEPQRRNEDNSLPKREFRVPAAVALAGHVRRRTDQMPRAEPPPVTPQSANHGQNPYQRPSKRARRHRQTLGEGSGSDSDSDNNNNGRSTRGDGSGSVARVQRPVESDIPKPSDPVRRRLEEEEAEEQKRVQEKRILRDVQDKLLEIHRHRNTIRSGADRVKKNLLKIEPHVESMTRGSEAPYNLHHPDMLRFVSRLEQQRRDYLHGLFFLDVQDDIEPVIGRAETYSLALQQVWEWVELGFLWRCRRFHEDWPRMLRWDTPPGDLRTHVVYVIKRMSSFVWNSLNSYRNGELPALDHRVARLLMRNIEHPSKREDTMWGTNVLVDNYIGKVVQTLLRAANLSFDAQEEILEPLYRRILASRHAGGPWLPGLGDRLSAEYLEWVSSGVDPAEIERCCLRAIALMKSRKPSNVSIRHEFCPGIVDPGVTSVVMFKGTVATSIKNVSDEELYTMGWFWDEIALEYWRFEAEPEDGISILKVTMDGAIRGMYTGNGIFIESKRAAS